MISLITSLYKSEGHLGKFLEKIKEFSDFLFSRNIGFESVVVSNDASAKEKEILEVFGQSNKWMSIHYVAREPLYASWNRGIELVKNEVVGFWNVDDVRHPRAVIDGLDLIKAGAKFVYFPFWYKRYVKLLGLRILAKKPLIKPSVFDRKEFTHSMHCGPFFIFTESLYQRVGPFDEQFKIAGDFDWCVRAAKVSDFKLSKEIAGEFINEGVGLSGSKDLLHRIENNIIYKRHNIYDKIEKVDEELMAKYAVDKIYHRGRCLKFIK